jgi:hypothetical protein
MGAVGFEGVIYLVIPTNGGHDMAHRIARLVDTLKAHDPDAAVQMLVETLLQDITTVIDSKEKIILVINDYNHFKVELLEAVRYVAPAVPVGTPTVTATPAAAKK